jgi:SulP family sulfate permease
MATTTLSRLPILRGVLPVEPARIPGDLLAGCTLAFLAIPEVMGYSKIAGTPAVTGLYTILLPMAVFAVVGSSRHLVVGADSATAAVMAAGISALGAPGSSEYVALAGLVALMAGALLLVTRLAKLGFLADFLSRTALVGFLTGVGVQVALGQIAPMLGAPQGGHGIVGEIAGLARAGPRINLADLAVSAAVLAVVLGARSVDRRIPGPLLAVVGAIVASWAFHLDAHGVSTLGPVRGGLPGFALPHARVRDAARLAGTAASVAVIIVAQSAATSRAYAKRHGEELDENADLVGLALANVAAALTGTFVVNGSPTKTQMVETARGRSQLAQLTTAGIVGVVLLFLTSALAHLPSAVLYAVVFVIGVDLVDWHGMARLHAQSRSEFFVALVTAVTVVAAGAEPAIVLAVALSVMVHLGHSYRPSDRLLVPAGAGHWEEKRLETRAQVAPGLIVYRFGASLYFANANRFAGEVLALATTSRPPVRRIIVSAAAIDDVDVTSADMLVVLHKRLAELGVTMAFADVDDSLRDSLERHRLTELLGHDAVFDSLKDALEAS